MRIPMILAASAVVLSSACAPVTPPDSAQAAPDPNAHVVCQAGDYQELVGRNRSEIPEAPAGRIFRTVCSSCPVTLDFRDNRVTFSYETTSGRIERVSCG